jgi:hypothetical protein
MIIDLLDSNFGTGLVGIIGVILGVVLDRWVRSWGKVQCTIGSWTIAVGNPADPAARQLEVTFLNGKELNVAVLDMRVEFYKGGKPLEAWTQPGLAFVEDFGPRRPIGPVNLTPGLAVPRTISVIADRKDKQRALTTADRAEFVASVSSGEEIRRELSDPWRGS